MKIALSNKRFFESIIQIFYSHKISESIDAELDVSRAETEETQTLINI